jgi:hypothetical protein
VTAFAGIAYQYRAVLIRLEHAHKFLRNLFNLVAEFGQIEVAIF